MCPLERLPFYIAFFFLILQGFATWVGWLAVDNIFPQWRVWEQFLVNEQARGLELDGLRSSHPIEVEIPDSSKVNEIFDAISYAKARRCLSTFLHTIL